MGADNGAVNDQVFRIRVIGQAVMPRGPNAPVAPARIAFIDGVPVAVFGGQETPGRAGTGNPEYAGSETAAVVFAADVEVQSGCGGRRGFCATGRMSIPH